MADDTVGRRLREQREAVGLSLSRLAAMAGYSRSHLSNMESGRRRATPALVRAYDVSLGEHMNIDRRQLMAGLAGVIATEVVAAIGGNDAGALSRMQTTHATDLVVADLSDVGTRRRLRRWMEDGDTAVLRVNAAGILAKVPGQDAAARIAAVLTHDPATRTLYTTAVLSRVCGLDWRAATRYASAPQMMPASKVRAVANRLAGETLNPRDAGARWCSANYLRDLSPMLGGAA